jgi:hypothetical protein
MDKVYNVVLVAPQGLGKTMIAQNIASAAVLAGHSVLFTTAAQMLLDVGAQESARALDQRLRHYCTRTGPLVIDEIGYLSYDNRTPTCSSRSSRAGTSGRASSSPRTWRSPPGRQSSQTRPARRPSSTASYTTEIISIEGESYRKRGRARQGGHRYPKTKSGDEG